MEELKYNGNWEILGKEYFGSLIINEKKGMNRLILYYKEDFTSLFSDNDIPMEIDFIKGKLIPHGVMCLLGIHLISRNTNISYNTRTVEFDVLYCMDCDFKDYNHVTFSKMEFYVPNILAWSGLNGISMDYEKSYTCVLKHKLKESISYSIDKNTTICFVPHFQMNANFSVHEETILKQYVTIQITSRQNQNLYFYLDIFNRIKTFIEMAIEKRIDIKEIIGYKRDYYRVFSGKRIYNEIKIYAKNFYRDTYEISKINDMLFDLPSVNKEIFLNWFSKYDLLEPILHLYNFSVVGENMPVETIFLNLVQALETYHSRFICNKKEDYKKRVENDILKDVPENLKKSHYDNLFDITQRSKETNYIILKSRLNDLMLANFDFIFFTMSDNSFPYSFVNKVVDTRHYFTHYSKSKENKIFKDTELLIAIHILQIVLVYYVLKELGFPNEFVKSKVVQRQKKVALEWSFYRTKNSNEI